MTILSKPRLHRYSCPAPDSCPRIAGFTLVETIVVLAVLGALMLIAYPALSKWVPNYQLKAAAQELYGNLQKAKLHAVKTNRDVTFSFTVSAAGCSSPSNYTFTDKDGKTVVSVKMKSGGVCIQNSDFDAASGFDPRGLPTVIPTAATSNKFTVTLRHARLPTRTYLITQSIAGSIQIQ